MYHALLTDHYQFVVLIFVKHRLFLKKIVGVSIQISLSCLPKGPTCRQWISNGVCNGLAWSLQAITGTNADAVLRVEGYVSSVTANFDWAKV